MTTLAVIAQNAACNATVDLLDGGTVEYQTAANAVVATLGLATPAFGDAAAGVADIEAVTPDANVAGNANPITKAVFKASGGAIVFTVPVVQGAPGPGQIGLSSTTMNAGDEAKLTSFSYTQPASAA